MDVFRLLAVSHGCDVYCPHCRAARVYEDEHATPMLTGWEEFVNSTAALKLARDFVELHIPFPQVSRDTLVQEVVMRSVLERYDREVGEQQALAENEQVGRAAAREELQKVLQGG